MRKIYESAQVVIACLGSEDPSDGHWVSVAKRLAIKPTTDVSLKPGTRLLYLRDTVFADFDDEDFQRDWTSFGNVLSSSWWTRGWVNQEILVAKHILVQFGDHTLDWDTVASAALVVYHVVGGFFTHLTMRETYVVGNQAERALLLGFSSKFARFIINGREDWRKHHQKNIIELLCHAQDCSVTDIRDRIYAFVGLADPGYSVVADYEIDMICVIRAVCKRIILYEGRLDVLCCCFPKDGLDRRRRREDIPSWTPDWSAGTTQYGFIYGSASDLPPYRASSNYLSAAAFASRNGSPNSVLKVQCLLNYRAIPRSTISRRPEEAIF